MIEMLNSLLQQTNFTVRRGGENGHNKRVHIQKKGLASMYGQLLKKLILKFLEYCIVHQETLATLL